MTQLIANGNAYSDDGSTSRDMRHGGFRSWLLPMLADTLLDAANSIGAAQQHASAAADSAEAAALSEGHAAQFALDASGFADAAEAALGAIADIGSGWTPNLRIAVDGLRYVLHVADWSGGQGPKPGTGYVAETGLVPDIANGLNIRGAVLYSDLEDRPQLGSASVLNVPEEAGGMALPGEVVRGDDPRLVYGGPSRGSQTITASQNIARAMFGTADFVLVRLRSGGGSGAAQASSSSSGPGGGEGGNSALYFIRVADLPETIPCVIGAGGASVVATYTSGMPVAGQLGGDTTFASVYRVPGGLGGMGSYGVSNRGFREGNGGAGGGSYQNSATSRLSDGPGDSSLHGGGGGGAGALSAPLRAAGASVTAGGGGVGVNTNILNPKGGDGLYPSGGGGGCCSTYTGGSATSGAGAPGNIQLWWF